MLIQALKSPHMSIFRLDLEMVMGGDGFEIHAQARRVGLEYAYCQKHMHLVSSWDKVNSQYSKIQKKKKKNFISQNIFKYCYFIKCFFFKYNSTNMEVIIAAVWYVISNLIPSINFKFGVWCEWIWLTSNTFLTGIFFLF